MLNDSSLSDLEPRTDNQNILDRGLLNNEPVFTLSTRAQTLGNKNLSILPLLSRCWSRPICFICLALMTCGHALLKPHG